MLPHIQLPTHYTFMIKKTLKIFRLDPFSKMNYMSTAYIFGLMKTFNAVEQTEWAQPDKTGAQDLVLAVQKSNTRRQCFENDCKS